MSTSAPLMLTVGEIARRLNTSVHRVEYVIRARGISPCGWAGNARVFAEDAVETVAVELEHIDALKTRRS